MFIWAIWPCSICEWSIGIGIGVPGAGCAGIGSIGIAMLSGIFSFEAGAALVAAFFFGAAFFAAGFFFSGIGMVMPGMCICAAAGAASWASASALATMSNLDFTNDSPVKEATR
jgi:hypothetical protein